MELLLLLVFIPVFIFCFIWFDNYMNRTLKGERVKLISWEELKKTNWKSILVDFLKFFGGLLLTGMIFATVAISLYLHFDPDINYAIESLNSKIIITIFTGVLAFVLVYGIMQIILFIRKSIKTVGYLNERKRINHKLVFIVVTIITGLSIALIYVLNKYNQGTLDSSKKAIQGGSLLISLTFSIVFYIRKKEDFQGIKDVVAFFSGSAFAPPTAVEFLY